MLDFLFGPPGSLRRADEAATPPSWGRQWPSGRYRTKSNVVVDEDLALTYAAVWCASRVLMEGVASLPLKMYRRTKAGHEEFPDDPRYHLVGTAPNPKMGSFAFREGRTLHQVNYGNGFAEIERDADDFPVNLWPIHPGRIRPVRPYDNVPGYDYVVRNNDGSGVAMRASEILHVPGAGSEDGVWGKGVVTQARESIGMGLATEAHGGAYFGGGAQPRAVITGPGMKDKDQRANFRSEWKEIHGSPDSGEIAILPMEAKYQAITLSNEDSQFLETRKHNVTEIARWYRLPPHMLADLERATFSNIEQQGIEFVQNSLWPWLCRWCEQLSLKLLTPRERLELFFAFDLTSLLRGDFKTRMEGNVVALLNGQKTLNDIMKSEGWNTIGPEGDVRFMPLNIGTLDRVIAGPPEPAVAADPDKPDVGGGGDPAGDTPPPDPGEDPAEKPEPTGEPTNPSAFAPANRLTESNGHV